MKQIISEEQAASAQVKLEQLKKLLSSVIFGQDTLVENLIIGLIARGHVLLEGLPGLGKTELVKALAKSVQLEVKRIQFTPDLLPGDITGNCILQENASGRSFVFQKGPIFANIVLADEINRASPKTQAALLEAMQERRVTVMGTSHVLPEPFFVLATQNPIELEGTYPLPEAQVDRFLFKLEVTHAGVEVLERIVLERELGVEPLVARIISNDELSNLLNLTRSVFLPPVVANYIARLVDATHPGKSKISSLIKFGASPRAALALSSAVRARALMYGRVNASFEDAQALAIPVLQHRIILDYAAKLQGKQSSQVVFELLREVPKQAKLSAPIMQTVTN